MKKFILSLALVWFYFTNASAQEIPQWVFWLAFEDATEAKDTVWIALDEEGTFGADGQFGEGDFIENEDEFHVFFYVDNEGNKSDIIVLPLTNPPGGTVYALNYKYPITLSWDTTLFTAPILMNSVEGPVNNPLMENEYFFNYHADFGYPSYHMLFEESVELPQFFFGSMNHFPLYFTFDRGFGNPLGTSETEREKLIVYPNPSTEHIQVSGMEGVERVSVFTLSGKLVMQEVFLENRPIDVSHLHEGAYILQVETEEGITVSKFVKTSD